MWVARAWWRSSSLRLDLRDLEADCRVRLLRLLVVWGVVSKVLLHAITLAFLAALSPPSTALGRLSCPSCQFWAIAYCHLRLLSAGFYSSLPGWIASCRVEFYHYFFFYFYYLFLFLFLYYLLYKIFIKTDQNCRSIWVYRFCRMAKKLYLKNSSRKSHFLRKKKLRKRDHR